MRPVMEREGDSAAVVPEGKFQRESRSGYGRIPDPCTIVIFGASGDLTRKKLIPALFQLAKKKLLPAQFSILGISRSPLTDETFRDSLREAVKAYGKESFEEETWQSFASRLFYFSADAEDPKSYPGLSSHLESLESSRKTQKNRLFYLAVAPQHYPGIIEHLGEHGLAFPPSLQSWVRVIIEKPFGRDLKSARELNQIVNHYCSEEQIYRIDHYLGKESVQNILVFRFANSIFEPIWNRQYIDHIQITSTETIGIENRGAYYDTAGALRDMVQNHMLQLVCTTAMEPPVSFTAQAVRDEKTKVLQAIRPVKSPQACGCTVRGQYSEGSVDGKLARAYRKEKDVAPDSKTETYCALKLFVDNWRWAGVPFYLRTGKRLAKRVTEISIQFHRTPHLLFARTPEDQVLPNVLVLRIQPDEGVEIKFQAKVPGPFIHLSSVDMDFQYGESFSARLEEAYERLLLDALLGDATLFARGDWIEHAWGFVTPILEGWEENSQEAIPFYAAGTWGPSEADVFMAMERRKWRS